MSSGHGLVTATLLAIRSEWLNRRLELTGAKPRAALHFSLRRFDVVDSLGHVPPPPALSALSRTELEALLVELFAEVATLKQMISEQREEIAHLKGLKGRPTIRPSGMDQGTEPAKS